MQSNLSFPKIKLGEPPFSPILLEMLSKMYKLIKYANMYVSQSFDSLAVHKLVTNQQSKRICSQEAFLC